MKENLFCNYCGEEIKRNICNKHRERNATFYCDAKCYKDSVTNHLNGCERMFNNIDNELSAYWLGFIMADGNMNDTNKTLVIHLSQKDEYHLKKLGSLLGLKVNNYFYEREN